MAGKLEITGVHMEADAKLEKYVRHIVHKLERYVPRRARDSVHTEVILTENRRQQDGKYSAEIIMHLPHGQLTAKESTVNQYAAMDIVEAKLRNQIKKYKETHADPRLYRRISNRLRRSERK